MAWAAPKGWSSGNACTKGWESSIPTGIPALDAATGGVPRGAITEIIGAGSCGKTRLALKIAAGMQKRGGVAVYLDVEHGLDAEFARALGVDPDELLVARPGTGDEAQRMAETLMQNRCADLIVFDSIAALSPGGAAEDVFAHSRMVSRMLGQLEWRARMANTALVLVNHLRARPSDVVGVPELGKGGWGVALRSALRLRLERYGGRRDRKGESILIRVVKNARGNAGAAVEWTPHYGAPGPETCPS